MPTMPPANWNQMQDRAFATLRGMSSWPLPGGDRGVAKTMDLVKQLVDQAIKDPYINRTAIEILQTYNVPQYDQYSAAQAIWSWVRANIRYVQDPVGKETVRPANVILEVRAGDCDDINGVLIPSLLGTIGIPSRGVTVAASRNSQDFSHIYAEAYIDGEWIPMDAARANVAFGQAPEMYWRRAEWPITGMEIDQVGILSGLGDSPAFVQDVSAAGATAAEIIQSMRADPRNIIPQQVMTPSGTYAAVPGGGMLSTSISGTEIIIGLGVLALFAFAMKGGR
jgi:Transglutaminase-like superfamily